MAEERERRCPYCGIPVPPEGHSGCGGLFREIMSTAASGEGRIGVPPEVEALRSDPSRTLRHYVLVQVAGRGGMGEVWKAWDGMLERWVAIKFLLGAQDADAARFLREARMAARLRHPNIAVVHEVGEVPKDRPDLPGSQFLVMDFVDGETLASAKLDLDRSIGIFIAVARAVDAAHRAGVIHRDLKPQNILLTRERWPFVTDFGLAKPLAPVSSLSGSGAVVGTPAYMPPEQAQGRLSEIDERSDIYSLGATFYRVLTGSDPFQAATPLEVLRLVCEHDPRAPRALRPDLPEPLDTVLRKCLSKEKAGRYRTALDLAEDLERLQAGTAILGRAPGPLATAFRRSRRPALSLALSAALLLAVSTIALREWKFRSRPAEGPEAREGPPSSPGAREETPAPRPSAPSPATEAAAGFLRALSAFPGLARLSEKSAAELQTALALPELPAERESSDPSLLWCRRATPLLLAMREGRAAAESVLELLASAVQLEEAGGAPAYQAFWPLASEYTTHLVLREARESADLEKDEREVRRRRADQVLGAWQTFVGALPPGYRRRHPELDALDRELQTRAAEFPSPLPELDAVDLGASLVATDPEGELERLRKQLVALQSRTGVTIESRRRLETLLVLAASYRLLLRGETEEDIAKDLAAEGERLRKLGGASEPGDVSPRIRRILASLLGR